MKTFQQYLTEAQAQHSVFGSIVENYTNPPFFFTPTVMKRLSILKPGVLAFHGTDLDGLFGLTKIQNKKNKQVSAVSGHVSRTLNHVMGGVETSGGVLILLKGDMAANFNRDAFTALTKGGRRTVLIGTHTDFGQYYTQEKDIQAINNLRAELNEAIGIAMVRAFSPVILEWIRNREDISFMQRGTMPEKLEALLNDLETLRNNTGRLGTIINGNGRAANTNERYPGIQQLVALSSDTKRDAKYKTMLRKAAGQFVKYYMDMMENSLKRSDSFKELFVFAGEAASVVFDELLISNFTIENTVINISKIVSLIPTTRSNSSPTVETLAQFDIPEKALTDKLGETIHDWTARILELPIDERMEETKRKNKVVKNLVQEEIRTRLRGIGVTFVSDSAELQTAIESLRSDVKVQPNAAMNLIYKD